MAVRGSIAIPKIIEALKNGTTLGVGDIGQYTIDKLKYESKTRGIDASGRLNDSFSYETNKEKSGVGGRALDTDAVGKPKYPYVVNIGTQVPYSEVANYGTVSGFQFGKNGAPSNRNDLIIAIENWIGDKVAHGNWFSGRPPTNNEELSDWAEQIADQIIEEGTDGHYFWEIVMGPIKSEAAGNRLASSTVEAVREVGDFTQKVEFK